MNILDLFAGRKVKVITDFKTEAILEIKEVKKQSQYVETGPSTKENDWYPDGYTKYSYSVLFTNGHRKEYNHLEELDITP